MEQVAYKAWSFLTRPETESGELYYADDPESHYVYDNKVANSRKVMEGDLAVIRNSHHVLGVGWIDRIEVAPPSEKIRYRCPTPDCGNPSLKFRKTKALAYRCDRCGNEFNDRLEELLTVEVSTANYARTFKKAEPPIPVDAIKPLYLSQSWLNPIRELNAAQVRSVLGALMEVDMLWRSAYEDVNIQIRGGHGVGVSRPRYGQQRFRQTMLDRFGGTCAFTGPQPPEALQAAHLSQYSETAEHDVRGGLLLRSDLHRLFDDCLITIDPDSWTIEVSPQLSAYPDLVALQGKPLCVAESRRPKREYIEAHAAKARSRWESPAV